MGSGVFSITNKLAQIERLVRGSRVWIFQNVSYVLSKLLQMSLSFVIFRVILAFKML